MNPQNEEVKKTRGEDSRDDRKKMTEGGERSGNALPEEMVEKILAMVPFPSVFKARVLSKSWLARLSPISSQDDEEKRRLVGPFHKQLRQWSTTWKAFCPVSWSGEDLIAYDRTTHSRLRLPSLSFLPRTFLKEGPNGQSGVLAIDGALVLVSQLNKLYVANILTRSWKPLPPPPISNTSETVFLSQTAETYTVIIAPHSIVHRYFVHPLEQRHFVHMYDATSGVWSSIKFSLTVLSYSNISSAAYVDGVLYWVAFPDADPLILKVVVVDTKDRDENPVKQFNLVPGCRGWKVLRADALICSANLLIIVETEDTEKKVLKIDLGSQSLLMVAPFIHPLCCRQMSYVTDDCYLFFALEANGSLLKAYHVNDENYCWLSCSMNPDRATRITTNVGQWIPSSFQPGLNPFVAV